MTVPGLDPPPEIRAKGVNFVTSMKVLEELYGPAFVQRVIGAMQGPVGEAARSRRLLAASWYPVAWYRELHRVAVDQSGEADLSARLGFLTTKADFKGVYSVLTRALGPGILFGWAPRILQWYYDGPRAIVLESGETGGALQLQGF